jgi:ATP-dependent RNA helicase RhlE
LHLTTEPQIHTPSAPAGREGFQALGLARPLRDAVAAAGYHTPTPIQAAAIPEVLKGRDLLGAAQTGTGKTAAFALPILDFLLEATREGGRPVIRALVLAPTRELAAQIGESFRTYGKQGRIRPLVVFGGVGKGPQIRELQRGVDVLVATPGRLLDLMNDGHVQLRDVEFFVLDEADRMLDMGFITDVKRIEQALPNDRQTLMFSATMPPEIRRLADELLVDPVNIAVDPVSSTVEPIEQAVYFVESKRKTELLLHLLKEGKIERALVFTRTKHGANRLGQKLVRARIAAAVIHGNKSQLQREKALEGFKRWDTQVVVATDVAARGIDIKDLSHVVNFDIPNEPESYVHRIGRTGRAGASGIALAFCSPEERAFLGAIERLTRKKVERLQAPGDFHTDRIAGGDTRPQQRGHRPQGQPRGRSNGSSTQRRSSSGRARTGSGGSGGSAGGRRRRTSQRAPRA